jgi:sensor histidine kinase YesM
LKESRWTGFSVNGEADDKVQIVGRELGNLGWVIIDETKLSYLEKDAQPLKGIMALIVVIGIAAAWGSSFFWIYRITKPLNYLNHMMYETEKGVFGLELDTKTTTQLGILGTQFNSMSVKIQNLIEENRRIEEEKRSYEIQTLWSQINPHFIYNTLNVIKWMSMIAKTDNITKCVMALGNILQPIFRRKGDYSKLKDEMDYIDNYITIMNFRYGNTIRYINKIPEEYYSQEVLSFILQPVVENCIVHGSSAGTKQILITVGLQSDEEVISLIVSDNGMGVEEDRIFELQEKLCKHCVSDEKDERHGIGMLNVNRRLFLYYGEEYGLTISNNIDGGARVVIKIPKNRKKIPES